MDSNTSYRDIDLILAEKQKTIDLLKKENQSLMKIISHDIRAPFTQLFAMMQLLDLESEDITPTQRHYFDRMYHSLASGMEMVKNLHDVRALEKDNISVVMEEIRLIPLIEKASQSFSKLADLKSIKICFEKGTLDPEIRTDSYILEKILANILSNSIKYSETHTEVRIRIEKRGAEIVIIYEDEGPGVPEDELSRLFEKYAKLSPKPTMGESTTGLGLYLAKQFAGLIEGRIEASNLSGRGLRIKVILPG